MTIITIGKTAAGNPVALHLDKANRHGLVTGATGVGKCWGSGTRMIMFDGTLKAVEKIQAGDLLMGPDSTPRTVLSTVAGRGPLYRITPVKGEPWVCNDVHILSLRCIHTKGIKNRRGDIVNVPLNEYLGWNATQKHIHKLWRTGVEFGYQPIKADPYLVGLYLAEGSSRDPAFNIGAHDTQLVERVRLGFPGYMDISHRNNCARMSFTRYSDLWDALKRVVDPDGERYLPRWIKHNSREIRLACLAGLLDGDGHLSCSGYDFIAKHRRLAEDVAYVCRSLGLAAYVKECTKGIKALNFTGTYWRVSISGHTDMIPMVLDRKRAPARRQIKDVLNTGFSVEPIGDGEYFGFELSGDRLCLLWDFTVTHNTVTLQVLAEGFSRAGVPVFAADIKGDLSGIAARGPEDGKAAARAKALGYDRRASSFPVRLWDLYEEHGLPVKTSVHEMGTLLLSRLLGLNETQEGILSIARRYMAEVWNAPIQTIEDLSSALRLVLDHSDQVKERFGNVTNASVGAILRKIDVLVGEKGDLLFEEPALDVADLLLTSDDGRGMVNLLDATRLMHSPRLYGAFLVFLLSKLYETLPEVGDLPKPKLVLFFDEAHLMFHEAPRALLEKVELMVRLVRSKGVGVYFVTQRATDVPEAILAQLGNRVQHALRAFTPRDARAVRAIAETYRPNPAVNVVEAITTMAVGEALVSTLQEDGTPMPVERVQVMPPAAQIGPISDYERDAILRNDPLRDKYRPAVDTHLAFRRRIGWPAYSPRPMPTMPSQPGRGLIMRALAWLGLVKSARRLSVVP